MSDAPTGRPISPEAFNQLFYEARTHSSWLDKPVPTSLLQEVYRLAALGPTSANSSPARFVFIESKEAKERLIPALMPGNVGKTRSAPVTVIVAYDIEFYEKFHKLWTFSDMKSNFTSNLALAQETAFRNGTLEGAYLIIAARALGLDCGPMSGFDKAKVDAEFFPDGKWKSNFLINLGYGNRAHLKPRSIRLDFAEACKVI